MAEVYVFHSGMPGIPQLSAAGAAGELEALLYACGVTGFGTVALDSLTQTGGVATAIRSAGLGLADGIAGMDHRIVISGANESGWNGEWTLSADPSTQQCTFAVPAGLTSPATGTITLKRAPAGVTRLATAGNKSVWRFSDPLTLPGYFMLDDSAAQSAGVRLAETAAEPVDYESMVGLCPTAAQISDPGLIWRKTDGVGSNKSFVIVFWRGGLFVFTAWSNSYPVLHDPGYAGACKTRKAGDAFPGLICGNTAIPSSPSSNHGFCYKNGLNSNGQYLQRAYSQTGSAINFSKTGSYFGSLIGSNGGPADPNPVNGANIVAGPIWISEGTTNAGTPLRGTFPLLWDPINCQGRSHLDILANMPELPGRKNLLVKASPTGQTNFFGIDMTGPA